MALLCHGPRMSLNHREELIEVCIFVFDWTRQVPIDTNTKSHASAKSSENVNPGLNKKGDTFPQKTSKEGSLEKDSGSDTKKHHPIAMLEAGKEWHHLHHSTPQCIVANAVLTSLRPRLIGLDISKWQRLLANILLPITSLDLPWNLRLCLADFHHSF
ncbi:hypothetical protein RJT34_29917 [Clitoria ternatea]|uniref:Uncharacterized protein n=1 Tax=Clitoria ternatea TaxID=43366 RepID=A0AAN9ERF8_CLITE